MQDDTCVCCGNYVPEGRMVCPYCESKHDDEKQIHNKNGGSMEYIFKFTDNEKADGRRQEVWSENRDEDVWFCAKDLNETPEDAVIGRDLFDARDFIDAVKLGFRIAQLGYERIEVVEEPWEEA